VIRGTGQRAGLSRRQVLDAAHALAVEEGLEALTMRALAARLGVVPNAVYKWIPNKAALLDALVDDTLTVVSEPAGTTPLAAVRGLLLSLFDAVTSRPALASLSLDRRAVPGPAAEANRERIRELLVDCGLDDTRAAVLTRVLLVQTIGFAAFVAQTEGGALLLGDPHLGAPRDTFVQGVEWTLAGALPDGSGR
jgi:TetR/AcrR family transcriptional regulator, tetracycline repressor protein